MPNPRKYRQLEKILRAYDPQFRFYVNRGKGSERVIYHPDIKGRPRSYPVKFHGRNTELSKGVIADIVRRFELPRDLL